MKLPLTQSDINRGSRSNPRTCPMARAADRLFPGYWCTVAGGRIRLYDHDFNHVKTYTMSKTAHEWYLRFDTRKPVKPATFIIKEFG